VQCVPANLRALAPRACQCSDEGGDEQGANLEKISGRVLTNTPLISANRAAGELAFIWRPACPPLCTFPHHVSGDEVETNNSKGEGGLLQPRRRNPTLVARDRR